MTRQAIKQLASLLMLLGGCFACSPQNPPTPTWTLPPATASPTFPPSFTPTPLPPSTVTPLACLTNPGQVEEGSLDSTHPPQEFRIYLPPCYEEKAEQRYPVLYLLHGQTFTDDQWVRLGAAVGAGVGWAASGHAESPWAGAVIGAGAGMTLGGLFLGIRGWIRERDDTTNVEPLRVGVRLPL